MKAKQFEIWIADLNPTIETEPGKARPVVIVQTDLLNKHHPYAIVCPIATKVLKESEILRIHLKKGSCGLEVNSDIMMDQVRAIDHKRLIRKVGDLTMDQIIKVKNNLETVLILFFNSVKHQSDHC
jgi:mRNA interferase MazF